MFYYYFFVRESAFETKSEKRHPANRNETRKQTERASERVLRTRKKHSNYTIHLDISTEREVDLINAEKNNSQSLRRAKLGSKESEATN